MKLRVLVVVALALTLAACTPQTSEPTTTTVPRTRLLPVVDLSATPAGWVAVADGDLQISVPATWWVLYNSGCPAGSPLGEILVNPSGEFCPLERAGQGPQDLVRLTVDAFMAFGRSSLDTRRVINGLSVYDDHGTYSIPSLTAQLRVSGPLAQRVLHTATRAPRTVALASGPAPVVPSSWRSVSYAGLRLSVPSRWPTHRWTDVGVCSSNGPTLPGDSVFLTTATHLVLCKQPARLPLVQQPSDGVQIDVDPSPSLVTGKFSNVCLVRPGLVVCPADAPAFSILLLRVTERGRARPVYVSVGLAGNGMVARTILYSLRAA
ncbi:MAG: hypothetical protein ABR925_09470 [Acidimicrobiales bacterium]